MNRLNLIIDNIMYAKIIKEGAHQDKLLEEALAAARELKALKPVCVITDNEAGQISMQTEEGKPFFINRHIGAKLFALDEVTK